MTALIRIMPDSISRIMMEQRRLAGRARCRVKVWHLTEAQALQLADETSWQLASRRNILDMFEAMRRGEVSMLGALVHVIPPQPIVVDSSAWTGR